MSSDTPRAASPATIPTTTTTKRKRPLPHPSSNNHSTTSTTPLKIRKTAAQSIGDIALKYKNAGHHPSNHESANDCGEDSRTASRTKASDMRKDLKMELDGHVYVDVEGMYDVYLGATPGQHPPAVGAWRPPPPALSDNAFVPWLVHMLNALQPAVAVSAPPPLGRWQNTKSLKMASGNSTVRGPDFGLVRAQAPREHLLHILVVGEHQSGDKGESVCILQLADYAAQALAHQPLRVYAHGLLTRKDGGIRLYVFDRGGAVASTEVAMDCASLGFLACAYGAIGRRRLGLPEHDDRVPLRDGRWAVLETTLCRRPCIMGRCTFCATARSVQAAADDGDDGDDDDGAATGEAVHASPLLIIKRSWRADERASEGALLELATSRGAVGCARHVAHEDLTDIATLRNGLGTMGRPVDFARGRLLDMVPITVANRIYSSIVMTPVGTPITSCSTSSGSPPAHLRLLHALLGGLIGHASLFFTCRLLHRDISASNVMYCATPITLPPETTPATETQRRYAPAGLRHLNGFLIDLDFAVEYPPTAASGAPHKTGTLPFISIGVLDAEEHAYGHDLESFLYVLLWVCLGSDQGHGPLGELWQAGTLESIALIKSGFVTRTNHFENRLGNDFMPQFGAGRPLPTPLKELARAWRKVLFAIEGSGGDGAPGSASEEVYHVPSRSRTRGYIKPGLSEWDAFIRMRDSLWDAIQTLSAPEENSD